MSDSPLLEEAPETCIICYEPLNSDDLQTLNCEHKFHESCINTWAEYGTNCPLCSSDMGISTENPVSEEIFYPSAFSIMTFICWILVIVFIVFGFTMVGRFAKKS